jgi:hypothetical protein
MIALIEESKAVSANRDAGLGEAFSVRSDCNVVTLWTLISHLLEPQDKL